MKRFLFTLTILLWAVTAWATHPITSAQFTESGMIRVTMDDGRVFDVPDDPANRHRSMVAEWVAEGNTITAYVAPPPPTDAERIDAAFPQTDVARVLFEAFFAQENRIRALEGSAAITRAQLRDWLKAKLP